MMGDLPGDLESGAGQVVVLLVRQIWALPYYYVWPSQWHFVCISLY